MQRRGNPTFTSKRGALVKRWAYTNRDVQVHADSLDNLGMAMNPSASIPALAQASSLSLKSPEMPIAQSQTQGPWHRALV